MPRGPRLDAPGVLHHVVVRGADQREVFPGDDDRADFVRRLARLVPDSQTTCLAWSLGPNQAELALRSGPRGLAHLMRRLLTGYAVSFNQRHRCSGHLFRDRYHSVACEEESRLGLLVRHVHLAPLRGGLVKGADDLSEFPWCGHPALLGRTDHPWQDTAGVLARFAPVVQTARREYAAFVAEGLADHDGLRSDRAGIAGSLGFAESLRTGCDRERSQPTHSCRAVVEALCRALGLSPEALASGRRTRPLSNGRAVIAYVARTRYRISGAELSRALGTSPPAITQAEQRGLQLLRRRLDLRVGLQDFLN